MWANNLDGTLPAELGKLTDLETLCADGPAPPLPRSPSAGPVRRRADALAVVRSGCGTNKLSGTIGGWIGSMARLTRL